jgi:predicted dienelactone hydrolase
MRILEVIICVLLPVNLGLLAFPSKIPPDRLLYAAAIPAGVILLHLYAEGYRWTMVPAYALTGLVLGIVLCRNAGVGEAFFSFFSRHAGARITAGLLAFAFFFAAAGLPALLPVFRLPAPPGSAAVGTAYFRFVDPRREEPITAAPGDHREIAVQAWYPAGPVGAARRMPYLEDAAVQGAQLSKMLRMPAYFFNYLSRVKTHSYRDAPVAAAPRKYPVLIYSHGYAFGWGGQHKVLMEALASQGYVVLGITHAYEGAFMYLPDGRVKYRTAGSEGQYRAVLREVGRPEWIRKIKAAAAMENPDRQAQAMREIVAAFPRSRQSMMHWAADVRFLIDQIERLNARGAWKDKLDTDRIGVIGMSFGGGAVSQAALTDGRIKAVVDLDGAHLGDALLGQGVPVPYLVMYSQPNEGLYDVVFNGARQAAYRVTVAATRHYNYSDFGLFSPLFKYVGFVGDVEAGRGLRITNDCVLLFLDKYLKNKDVPLQSLAGRYGELSIRSRNGGR